MYGGCPQCGGKGWIPARGPMACSDARDTCWVCRGTGSSDPEEIARREATERARDKLWAAASREELERRAAALEIPPLQARIIEDAGDQSARFELADALFRSGASEAAIEELMAMVKHDRKWNEQAARRRLLEIFAALGSGDPLTVNSRRRLSSILFS
jgi:putative thioredoxin